ncbi:MAG: IMP dehydrogenase [Candidatus Peribacteria bacterium]|jgi:IMP dehydrogenase|nr:IMP dehydrogenase [Candidatus Peribacteria bacterium]
MQIKESISRTFGEYLLIPGLTTKSCIPANVSLTTPLTKHRKGEKSAIELNIPFTSAIMQAVSGPKLAIELARNGGLSFIFGSQLIERQAEMVRKVKKFKAGFVISDANLKPSATLQDVLKLKKKTGHSTIVVTEDGTTTGKLLGLITSRDYREKDSPEKKLEDFMTPFNQLIVGIEDISLDEANEIILKKKLNVLPIIDKNQHLVSLVFRKDYESHQANPLELSDVNKSLLVGAGVNTHDYKDRVPALIKAGVDVLCIDSSDGHSEWQKECLLWVKNHYSKIPIGAGNVVNGDAFMYLVNAGADFVKVGIGGGSICITREQKGIGRGQASALMAVAKTRDEYLEKTGMYIPICSDGGIVQDYHMVLALAMGADFLMMGRYFARFDEAPGEKLLINNQYVKEYWGEGSNRAQNWQRYGEGSTESLKFEEGIDSYVPYAGPLKKGLEQTLSKIKATMCSCGVLTVAELQKKAVLTLVSEASITEGGTHDVMRKS